MPVGDSDFELSTNTPSEAASSLVTSGDGFAISTGNVDKNSLQLLIQIDNASATNRFTFSLEGASGIEHIGAPGSGVYRIINSDGRTSSWLSEPWAHDANGEAVPTYFEFVANELIQVIDITNPAITFPVTADPYLWIDLISSVRVSTSGSYKNVKVAVTPWLGAQYAAIPLAPWTLSIGASIAQNYGWAEVLDKIEQKYSAADRQLVATKKTYKNQWDCHALGAPVIFVTTVTGFDTTPTWDLEGSRPSNTNLSTWVEKWCNW